jgi:hypothetical protein
MMALPKSEVALLRERIEQEHAASVRAMSGFATGSPRFYQCSFPTGGYLSSTFESTGG